jgi:arylsulfatase A-like enzyme
MDPLDFFKKWASVARLSRSAWPVPGLATGGLCYNEFHVTALCSPNRAALLTERNHHVVNTGAVMDVATAFPGTREFVLSAVPLAEILRLNGYSTAVFGKDTRFTGQISQVTIGLKPISADLQRQSRQDRCIIHHRFRPQQTERQTEEVPEEPQRNAN